MSYILSSWFYVIISIFIGVGAGVQLTMIAAISRQKGSLEAVFTSMVATGMIIISFLIGKSFFNNDVGLPQPFEKPIILSIILIILIITLFLIMREIQWYYALTGLLSVPLLVGSGLIGPKIGLGIYISATIVGSLLVSLIVDHLGAFGGLQIPISLQRVIGAILLILGVILIRGLGK